MWAKEKPGNHSGSSSDEGATDEIKAAFMQAGGENGQDVIAFVGKGVEFKGVITYNGTVRIDGNLDGEIHTEGILLVGEDAVLTAKISAGTVISKGKITGDIVASDKVRLLSPAILNGSVKAPMLSMEEGVLFNGSCEMARGEIRELPREHVVRSVGLQSAAVKRASS
jgi:cytoskeletal protein CcmA (bactofilin family)